MAIFGFLKKREPIIGLPPATGEAKAEGRHVSYLDLPPLPTPQKPTTQPTPIKLPEFPKMPAKEEAMPSAIPPIDIPKAAMAVPMRMAEPKRAPSFVAIQQYNAVLSELDNLKGQISKAEDALNALVENKSREDSELERWRANLEEIERKLMFVDKTLFER